MNENIKSFNKISNLSKIIGQIVKKNISPNEPILICYSSDCEISRFVLDLKIILDKNFPISKMKATLRKSNEKEQLQEIIEFQKKSIGIRISESMQFYEGEVIDLISNPIHSSVKVGDFYAILELKSSEGKLKLKISGNIYKEFLRKKTKIGDIIRIFPENGSIQNLGQSVNLVKSDHINNINYFTLPNGKVFKKKILISEFTLWDFELENFGKKNYSDLFNIQTIRKINDNINALLWEYSKIGKIQIFKGILIIENTQFLNPISFHFLCKDSFNLNFPVTLLLTDKIYQPKSSKFSLDSSNPSEINVLYTTITRNFTRDEILKTVCFGFLKEKRYYSGFAIKKIKTLLESSNLEYCKSLAFLSTIAVNKERFSWICKNTLEFFDMVHLNVKHFLVFYLSKINFLKIYRSFNL